MRNNPPYRLLVLLVASGVLPVLGGARPAAADTSHARIVRLSSAQGDVRFARSAGSDSLTDPSVAWEAAAQNQPIRQGYVLGTGSGRAAVEFEYGNSAAYLDENAVLEFQDLSLRDGVRSTRLVLRQGTAAFVVAREGGEYFSVTSGEVTAKIEEGANFRVDVYDDAVTIGVKKGRVTLTTKSETKVLEGGQSVSVRNGATANVQVQALPAWDDFDQWVSDTQESATAAYSSSMQYVSSPNYSYGFADLYTYGNWFACPGYFNNFCWRPFGVGIQWRPFHHGHFCHDRRFGPVWVSEERWGWLPYHHGGWLFSPIHGWMWSPGLRGQKGLGAWRPFTGTWVRSGGQIGVVPSHPMDARGVTPLNLMHGVMMPAGVQSAAMLPGAEGAGHNWRVLKSPPAEAIRLEQTVSVAPERISRTVAARGGGMRYVSVGRDSMIVYDPVERKFVNAANPNQGGAAGMPPGAVIEGGTRIPGSSVGTAGPGRMPRNSAAAARPMPPAAARSSSPHSPPSAPRTAPAPHTSTPHMSAPHSSSGSSSHPSSSSSSHTASSSSGGRSH